eukprot:02031_3
MPTLLYLPLQLVLMSHSLVHYTFTSALAVDMHLRLPWSMESTRTPISEGPSLVSTWTETALLTLLSVLLTHTLQLASKLVQSPCSPLPKPMKLDSAKLGLLFWTLPLLTGQQMEKLLSLGTEQRWMLLKTVPPKKCSSMLLHTAEEASPLSESFTFTVFHRLFLAHPHQLPRLLVTPSSKSDSHSHPVDQSTPVTTTWPSPILPRASEKQRMVLSLLFRGLLSEATSFGLICLQLQQPFTETHISLALVQTLPLLTTVMASTSWWSASLIAAASVAQFTSLMEDFVSHEALLAHPCSQHPMLCRHTHRTLGLNLFRRLQRRQEGYCGGSSPPQHSPNDERSNPRHLHS